MASEPVASRPHMPGYGIPGSRKGMLEWSHARERLEAAANYWVATASPKGDPHAVPVWGVWIDDRLYFDGGPQTRHMRNVAATGRAVVHLESGSDVVIVEGEAGAASVPDLPLTTRVSEGYRAKYGELGYAPQPDSWDGGGLWYFRPRRGFAWTAFPRDVTKFEFEE